MTVLMRREPRHLGAGWKTIRYALDTNARTLRLCLILLTLNAPVIVLAVRLTLRVPW
jgi:hypothetical protein